MRRQPVARNRGLVQRICRRFSNIWNVADDDVGPANQNLCDESVRIAAMKPILDHLDRIVRPGLRSYAEAEAVLTKAHAAQDQSAIDAARIEAGLAARQAVDGLHHLADFMWKEPGCWPRAF